MVGMKSMLPLHRNTMDFYGAFHSDVYVSYGSFDRDAAHTPTGETHTHILIHQSCTYIFAMIRI